ncbi:SCO family protein [Propionivibrio sp.]|uniref:SCO family protein n=1 Tax=Propionivibrio sp. TaxID=2212460 RepID=UPI003BF3D64D
MKSRALLIAIIVALGALLVWLAFFWQPVAPGPATKNLPHSQLQLAQAPQGGDFTLQGFNGPVALKDFRGKVVLIYFGYTFCPDVCPTSLSLMAQALSSLETAERERVQGIFVSVDPDRDTPEHLNVYAPYFHPGIIGITGSTEQLTAVASQYGASYTKQKPNADGLYAVDHSSITYVIDPNGKLAASLPHASTPQQIVAAVRPLLAAGTSK